MSKIIIKTDEEIEIIHEGGRKLARIMEILKEEISRPGYLTKGLDKRINELCEKFGAKPAFMGYRGYPATVCLSLNDEIVHCPPGDRVIKEGDLVSLDFGLKYKNLYTDSAISFGVGKMTSLAEKLIKVTEASLYKGIEQVRPNGHIGDIGQAVQRYAEANGFSVVRDLTGHGVGKQVHEPPQVLNYGREGIGPIMKKGMVIAIEPMVNVGDWRIKQGADGWSIMTADGELSAHFEHTVAVIDDGYEILTKE